jgi:hypothetical protein
MVAFRDSFHDAQGSGRRPVLGRRTDVRGHLNGWRVQMLAPAGLTLGRERRVAAVCSCGIYLATMGPADKDADFNGLCYASGPASSPSSRASPFPYGLPSRSSPEDIQAHLESTRGSHLSPVPLRQAHVY